MIKRVYIKVIPVFLLVMLSACKKGKVPTPLPPLEKSKFELIPGEYRMYDTLGNYLGYDMTISHWFGIDSTGYRKDTFLFENFDGQFSFKEFQGNSNTINWPKYYFYIGHHDPLFDSLGNRWQLFDYGNHYSNDSIYMYHEIQNIKYYLHDLVPYEKRIEKRIGVKK